MSYDGGIPFDIAGPARAGTQATLTGSSLDSPVRRAHRSTSGDSTSSLEEPSAWLGVRESADPAFASPVGVWAVRPREVRRAATAGASVEEAPAAGERRTRAVSSPRQICSGTT